MHILFCTHDSDSGGAARSLSVLVSRLATRHRVSLLSLNAFDPCKDKLALYQGLGVRLLSFAWGWLPISYAMTPVDEAAQRMRCKEHFGAIDTVRRFAADADVVCFNGYPSASLAPFLPDCRKVLYAREMVDETSPELAITVQQLKKYLDHAIAIGPQEAAQLASWGIPNTVIYNAAPATPHMIPLPPSPPVRFGMFGQVLLMKGQDTLAGACVMHADVLRRLNVRVHIFGGTKPGDVNMNFLQHSVQAFIDKHGVSDIVTFDGWVNDVEAAMAAVHCVVRPDNTGSPWGRDVLEAMSIGRPVLATGTEDVFVKPPDRGWLLPAGNPKLLGALMASIAQDRAGLERVAHSAFMFAQAHFDPDKNAQAVEKVLLEH